MSFLLLADGSSKLLLENGTDRLLLVEVDSTVTGTIAVTEANDTSAASGSTVTGTVAATEAADTLAAAGQFGSDVTGTVAVTEAADTSTASGSSVTGSLAVTEAADTVVASGTYTISGTVAVTEAADTVVATGTYDSAAAAWPGTGVGTVHTVLDRNRTYVRVGSDTSPTLVMKSTSGSTTAVLLDNNLDPYDYDTYDITFDVALNGINVASVACTPTTPLAGLVTFTFPTLPAGVYTARFTNRTGDDNVWSYPARGLEVRV